jgi:ribosome biogenesis GTPase A
MEKARRQMESLLGQIDAAAEMTDARCPESARNPMLSDLFSQANKPRLLILNKADLADPAVTRQWMKHYEQQGLSALQCNGRDGSGVQNFPAAVSRLLSERIAANTAKGVRKAMLVFIAGIPNVGKSSLINRLAGGKKTKIGDTPGVTRGIQRITIGKDIDLLDTPGILWHKFDDPDAALRLAFTGAIRDEVLDSESLALSLAEFLCAHYPKNMTERYNLSDFDNEYLSRLAKKRGFLLSGGMADTERAANILIDEFRAGKIGRISLESPITAL